MSLINVSNLTFAYDGGHENIFENVSFQIDTDWKSGLIGRNGRGKTTFLSLLLGKYEYSGKILSSVKFEYFPYDIPDKSTDTAGVIEHINPGQARWKLMRELYSLEIQEDVLYRPFSTLSNGERTKVLLAALFLKENSFLLIDEPTNNLDTHGRETVGGYLKGKNGFILVSHDRYFLDGCVDHVISINKANIEIQRGNFSSWFINKELQDKFELAENEKLKKDIKRLTAAARRNADWSGKGEKGKYGGTAAHDIKPDKGYIGHKAAKMMKRSKAIESRQQNAIAERSNFLKNIENYDALKLSVLPYHSQNFVALEEVSLFYGNKAVCGNISFTINRGDRIALNGKNGSGKSSLIKLICGGNVEYRGNIRIGSQLKISCVQQDASHLSGNLSDYAARHCIDEPLFKAMLRKLDFSRVQFEKDMSSFSEGQKKKVLISRSLCEKAHLYIWDEPLNFIDIFSRIQIEELLLAYQPTILFVEHDKNFCKNIATKIINL